MLGFIGRWAASKGMVAVPNLIGLLNTAAQTAITNSGLIYGSSSTTTTGDSALADKVASQTPTSGTLADYESSVSFVYYNYVPVAPFFPPFFPPTFTPTPSFPFFPPTFIPTPSFPFFPPSFPFFPPSFPFFPPSFPFFPPSFPFVPPSFPFFPPSFPSPTTYYWCCIDGSPYSGQASSVEEAVNAAQLTCDNIGSGLSGGVYTTPQSCSAPPSFPFFPPTFPAAPSFPFFPPSFVSQCPSCYIESNCPSLYCYCSGPCDYECVC